MKHNCKGFTSRKVGCHATCESYQKYNAFRQEQRRKQFESYEGYYNPTYYVRKSKHLTRQLGDWQ